MLFAAYYKLIHKQKVRLGCRKRSHYYKLIEICNSGANEQVLPWQYLGYISAFAIIKVLHPVANHGAYAVLPEAPSGPAYDFLSPVVQNRIEAAYTL